MSGRTNMVGFVQINQKKLYTLFIKQLAGKLFDTEYMTKTPGIFSNAELNVKLT